MSKYFKPKLPSPGLYGVLDYQLWTLTRAAINPWTGYRINDVVTEIDNDDVL